MTSQSPDILNNTLNNTSHRFNISVIVRLTLLSLYIALTIPLPFLADLTHAPITGTWLWVGIGIGFVGLFGVLSEQVLVNENGITVTYPLWVKWLLRKGWTLAWSDITALKPRVTGQGGIVYYFVSRNGAAYLLPMRIAGFARLVAYVNTKTTIDTRDVRPLAQPWMYLILLCLTIFLLLVDLWTITTAMGHG
ncbi:MAG: hypothetical protein ACK456_08715 [Pseudanabaenaceae cyanobacterium]|jgi:hypothetical protein